MFGRRRKMLEAVQGVIAPGVGVEFAEPVKEAAKTARNIGIGRHNADSERRRLVAINGEMFPMEAEAREKVRERLTELNYAAFDAQFQRIDLSFLNWRRKDNGWPVFAVFSPNEEICQFEVDYSDGYMDKKMTPGSPRGIWSAATPEWFEIRKMYDDVFAKLTATVLARKRFLRYWNNGERLSCKFKGVIPQETRMTIIRQKANFDTVFVVAQAEWEQASFRMEAKDKDPLVIGLKDKNAWLLDRFDTTPAEQIVASEFAYGQPKEKDWEK